MRTRLYGSLAFRFLIFAGLFLCCADALKAQAPANDNCANATVLTVGAACVNGSNARSTLEAGEPTAADCWSSDASNTVWYKFTTGAAGSYTVSTDNGVSSSGSTELKMWAGTCGSFTELACADGNGVNDAFAAIIRADGLAANTTYYVQMDVFGGSTTSFCINVKYSPAIPNDCVFNAIDITSMLDSVNRTSRPFRCRAFEYGSAGSRASGDVVNGNAVACDPTTKFKDVWFKFTKSANTPDLWLDAFADSGNVVSNYTTALYSGTPGGTCGPSGNVTGLTYQDCSDGVTYGGLRDVSKCTTSQVPRINIGGLPNGTYYFRLWDYNDTAYASMAKICAETSTPLGVTSDPCPTGPTIGKTCAPNTNVNELYTDLGNEGCFGNSCGTAANEPDVATNPAGQSRDGCTGSFATNTGYQNTEENNSAIYAFEINGTGTCQADVTVKFSNITSGGFDHGTLGVQVMNGSCAGGVSAVMTGATTKPCIELRSNTGTLPNGVYYIVVDGSIGHLLKYDLGLVINYSGIGCTANTPPSPPTGTGASRCGSGTATITAAGCTNGTIKWYSAANGGTALATGASFTTPSITLTTTYYAACVVGSCESVRTPVTVNVTAAPTLTVNSPTICSGTPATLTATPSAPGGTYLWTPGNETTATVVKSPSVTTNYNVTYSLNGCNSSAQAVVTVMPAAGVKADTMTVCSGTPATLHATVVNTGGAFLWRPGSLNTQNIAVSPSATADYTVVYTLNGCRDSAVGRVVVNSRPGRPVATSPVNYCQGATASALSATGSSLKWYTLYPGTGTSTAPVPSTATSTTRQYYVTSSVSGCESDPDTITVRVTKTPKPGVADVFYCYNATATPLTATGSDLLWYTDTAGTGSSTAPTPNTSTGGTTTHYYVSQTVNGCRSDLDTIRVFVTTGSAPPTTTPVTYCQFDNATPLTASGSNLLWYSQQTGGSQYAGTPTPSTNDSGLTSYWVSQAISGCGGESGRTELVVRVDGRPVPPTVSDVSYCQNQTASPLASSTPGTVWYGSQTGGIAFASAPTPSTTGSAPVTYYAEVSRNGCTSLRAPQTVRISPKPAAPIVTSDSACQYSASFALTAQASPGATLVWSQNGSQSNTAPVINTSMAGLQSCSVWQSVNGCAGDSTIVSRFIKPQPAAPSVSGISYCTSVSNPPAYTASGSSLRWYDPQVSPNPIPQPAPPTGIAGTYIVYVTQTVNGCESERAPDSAVVNQAPLPPQVSDVRVCEGQLVVPALTLVTGSNPLWYSNPTGGFGIGSLVPPNTLGTGSPASATYDYWVTQTGANGCESAPRVRQSATVFRKPQDPSVSPVNLCFNAPSVRLTPSGPGYSWYDSLTGGTRYPDTPTVTANSSRVRDYFVAATANGCESNRIRLRTTVYAAVPAPTVQTPVRLCEGEPSRTLTAGDGTMPLRWYTDPSDTTGSATAPGTPPSGNATFYVSQLRNGCVSPRSEIEVAVSGRPAIGLRSTSGGAGNGYFLYPVCQYSLDTFYVEGSIPAGSIVSWNVSSGNQNIERSLSRDTIVVRMNSKEPTRVTVTATNGQCGAADSIRVEVTETVKANLVGDSVVCQHTPVNVKLDYGRNLVPDSFRWDFAGATVQSGLLEGPYLIRWDKPGVYRLQATAFRSGTCPIPTESRTITVRPVPDARIAYTSTEGDCAGSPIRFTALTKQDGNQRYEWTPQSYFIDNPSGETDKDAMTARLQRSSYIRLTVTDQFDCAHTDSLLVNVKPCCEVYLPDAFSPNNDSRNDWFFPVTNGNQSRVIFKIFNRWGNAVFETSDMNTRGWDGTYNGVPQEVGTYYVMMSYYCTDGRKYETTKDITLIR